jgi:hypothetical protein
MRFYTKQHRYYCGIDLHARSMYVCILDPQGEILLHRNMPCARELFLKAVAPYREDMAVAVECIFTWYWLADLCGKQNIPFVRMIDQEYQERLPEGMIRCYLVHERVVGFGHQAINVLFPAPVGAPSTEAPCRAPSSMPEFETLKRKLEQEWVPAVQRLLEIETESLPILWDCDFLLGPQGDKGEDTMFFAKSTSAALRRIPNLRCLTLSMRQWLGYRRRDSDVVLPCNRRLQQTFRC